MSATDPPLTNLYKAMKKLVLVQRNLKQAGRDDLVERVIAVKSEIAAAIEAEESRHSLAGPKRLPVEQENAGPNPAGGTIWV